MMFFQLNQFLHKLSGSSQHHFCYRKILANIMTTSTAPCTRLTITNNSNSNN